MARDGRWRMTSDDERSAHFGCAELYEKGLLVVEALSHRQ